MLNLVLALLAGVVTIAAPCTLPMLPILLGASVGQTGKVRPAMIAAGFVISFSATALALSAITRMLRLRSQQLAHRRDRLLLGFGLLMIWPAPFEWLSRPAQRADPIGSAGSAASRQGNHRRLCPRHHARPGLDALRRAGAGFDPDRVATSTDTAWASVLLVVYAIGAAIPMLAIAYGGQAVTTRVRSIARFSPRLQQGFGVVVIAFAVAS